MFLSRLIICVNIQSLPFFFKKLYPKELNMSLPKLKLISFTLCPYVQRAMIVLNEKNIPFDIEYIDLSEPPPWFYDISPLEKVPVLLVNDEPLFESMVICEYLDEITGISEIVKYFIN